MSALPTPIYDRRLHELALGFSPRAKAPASDRFNGLLSSLQSDFRNLRLAVPTTSDSRSSGLPIPCCWLGVPWGLANYWRNSPFRIRCTSGVHIGNMATCWLGGSLKLLWPFRDRGAGLQIQSLPAILLLAGDDEDLLARARFAKLGLVEPGNLASAANRRRHQADVGDIPALVTTAAARLLAEDHNPKSGDSKSWPELRAPDFVEACRCK